MWLFLPAGPDHGAAADLLHMLQAGQYAATLRRAARLGVLPQPPAGPVPALGCGLPLDRDAGAGGGRLGRYFNAVQFAAAETCAGSSSGFDDRGGPQAVLVTAAAALYAFLQANLTGCGWQPDRLSPSSAHFQLSHSSFVKNIQLWNAGVRCSPVQLCHDLAWGASWRRPSPSELPGSPADLGADLAAKQSSASSDATPSSAAGAVSAGTGTLGRSAASAGDRWVGLRQLH